MSLDSIAETPDARYPDLAGVALRAVAVAEQVESHGLAVAGVALNAITDKLYSGQMDAGYRDLVIDGATQFGVPSDVLGKIYDEPLPKKRAVTLKDVRSQFEGSPLKVDALVSAVARFESCKHIRLVYTFAGRMASRYGHEAEELFFHGYMGLLTALLAYNPKNGAVSTYAQYRISGTIRDGIRAESPVPKRLTTFLRRVEAIEERLFHELSRVPTHSEVAEALGDQAKYLPLCGRLAVQASLDERGEELARYTTDSAETSVLQSEIMTQVQGAVRRLESERRKAVELVCLQEKSIREAASSMGLSQTKVQGLVAEAMEELRGHDELRLLAAGAH